MTADDLLTRLRGRLTEAHPRAELFSMADVLDALRPECEAIARDQASTIGALNYQLACCYRLTGADPDGNEDWRLALDAVDEVDRVCAELKSAESSRVALRQALHRLVEQIKQHPEGVAIAKDCPWCVGAFEAAEALLAHEPAETT